MSAINLSFLFINQFLVIVSALHWGRGDHGFALFLFFGALGFGLKAIH